MTKKNINN